MQSYRQEPNKTAIADQGLVSLHKSGEGNLSEKELIKALQRYNLKDALLTIAEKSRDILHSTDSNKVGFAACKDQTTGTFTTQFGLAYLANLLIISGANDYNRKCLSEKSNLLVLSAIYNNCLVQPEFATEFKGMDEEKFRALMIRMNHEQMPLQFAPVILIGRSIVLFVDILSNKISKKLGNLKSIFKEQTKLDISEYFIFALAIFALSMRQSVFRPEDLHIKTPGRLSDVLEPQKAKFFLDSLSTDYAHFRRTDEKLNKGLDPIYTKTRFNPLSARPLVTTDIDKGKNIYLAPNLPYFILRTYVGIYWWFDDYFKNLGLQQDFRNFFGEVFQEYAGIILKGIYGPNLRPEIAYGKGYKFFDWIVESNEKIYLFEIKAHQFALDSNRIANSEQIRDKEIKRVVIKTIKQMYNRVKEISNYPELKVFENKTLIPIAVFKDMPFISNGLYTEIIDDELLKTEEAENLPGLSKFKYFLMNIDDLELYDSAELKIDLEYILGLIRNNMHEDFSSIIKKDLNPKFGNRYLESRYRDFFTQIGLQR